MINVIANTWKCLLFQCKFLSLYSTNKETNSNKCTVITDTYLDAEQNADVTQWQAKKRFVVYLLSTTVSKFIVHG